MLTPGVFQSEFSERIFCKKQVSQKSCFNECGFDCCCFPRLREKFFCFLQFVFAFFVGLNMLSIFGAESDDLSRSRQKSGGRG